MLIGQPSGRSGVPGTGPGIRATPTTSMAVRLPSAEQDWGDHEPRVAGRGASLFDVADDGL